MVFKKNNVIIIFQKGRMLMKKSKIEKMLNTVIEKIEKRDMILIELTKEIALLRIDIKEKNKKEKDENL